MKANENIFITCKYIVFVMTIVRKYDKPIYMTENTSL